MCIRDRNEPRDQPEKPKIVSRTEVSLATALVNARDEYGNYGICRAVLETGSQVIYLITRI